MTILKFTPAEARAAYKNSPSLDAALNFVAALVDENKIGRGEITIIIQKKRQVKPKRNLPLEL